MPQTPCDHGNPTAGGNCCGHSIQFGAHIATQDSCLVWGGTENICNADGYEAGTKTESPLQGPDPGFFGNPPPSCDDPDYHPVLLNHTKDPFDTYVNLYDELCCVHNNVNYVEFTNIPIDTLESPQWWHEAFPFCNTGLDEGCNTTDGSPWELDYVDLGLNKFNKTSATNDFLCGSTVSIVRGCDGFSLGSVVDGEAGNESVLCSCSQGNVALGQEYENGFYGILPEGCDLLENVQGTADTGIEGCVPYGGACYTDNFEWFCDTLTADVSLTGGESEYSCPNYDQTYCNCGQLSECGRCLPPNTPDVEGPSCGAGNDICGNLEGSGEYGVTLDNNRYYSLSEGTGLTGTPSDNHPEWDTVCRDGYFCSDASGACEGVQGLPGSCGPEGHEYPCEDGSGDTCVCEIGGTLLYESFCFCNCDESDPDHDPVEITCYDTESDDDIAISLWACRDEDGIFEECGDIPPFGRFTSVFSEVWDQGCRDDGGRVGTETPGKAACNYSTNFENDCAGYPHVFDGPQGWEDDGEVGNTDCCVYLTKYCVADGSSYEGDIGEVAGANDLCDVDNLGNPYISEYCPICDCGYGENDTQLGDDGGPFSIDCNENQCGDSGYSLYPYTSTHDKIGQINLRTIEGGTCIAGMNCLMYTGVNTSETVPEEIQDDGPSSDFTLTGCNDPGALNYSYAGALHPDPTNNYIYETPVKTCLYCPGPDERAHCLGGYVFYFDEDTIGVSSEANVTDSSWSSPGNFSLGLMAGVDHADVTSNQLEYNSGDPRSSGACYCLDDLRFLTDLTSRVPGWVGSDFDWYETSAGTEIFNGALTLNQEGGTTIWDSNGRLVSFSAGGESCMEAPFECRDSQNVAHLGDVGSEFNTVPESIGNLVYATHIDLSKNFLKGQIPKSIEGLYLRIQTLDFSYNDLGAFDESLQEGHGIYVYTTWHGLCAIAEELGFPDYDNPWLYLMGNKICPTVESNYANTMSYPECLSPSRSSDYYYTMTNTDEYDGWCEWIWNNLGYADIPCHPGETNNGIQRIEDNAGNLDCEIEGCMQPEAENYWPEATSQCPSCCRYDKYLHFPWGTGTEITIESRGSFGGDITLFEMVQALHANIHGFQYNARGNLDVSGTPQLGGTFDPLCVEASNQNALGAYLTNYQINECSWIFSNDIIVGDDIINHWDGIWLRDAGYYPLFQDGTLTGVCETWSGELDEDDNQIMIQCDGDARPLEFINRVEYEAENTYDPSGFRDYWYSFFPATANDISMQGIQWFEDYDVTGDGSLGDDDIAYWFSIGRIDIAEMIAQSFPGMPYPPFAPEDYELWEQASPSVSMSYSQKFITETQAGFTLYPSDDGPGTLTRNGQWKCNDNGNADVCYTDLYACGRAPEWVEDCTPCGSGGDCIPLTLDTAAEGYQKISKTKNIIIPYFSNGNSNIIKGGNIYTASMSSSNHPYFFSVMDGDPNSPSSITQFDVTWGHIAGSGSDTKNDTVIGTSEVVYKQYSSMLLDDAEIDNGFMITSGSDVRSDGVNGDKDRWIYVLNLKRKNFEDQIHTANWTLTLSGSHNNSGKTISLTDNSLTLTSPAIQTQVGRRYDIVSGSDGTVKIDNNIGTRYGWLYPDMGVMVFGEKLSNEFTSTTSPAVGAFNSGSADQNQLYPLLTTGSDTKNSLRFINTLKNNVNYVSGSLKLFGEKEVTEVIYVCDLDGGAFNFTNNFSILSGSGRKMYSPDTGVMHGFSTAATSSAFTSSTEFASSNIYTGGPGVNTDGTMETQTTLENNQPFVWPGSDVSTMHGDPHSFITGVELFDEHGEMLAIARLSKPLKKSNDREAIIKVKLQF